MPIEVRLTANLQNLAGGRKVIHGTGATVAELLDNLEAQYPGIKGQLITHDGELHRFVNIYLNDEDIRYLGKLATPLKEGDVLSILPALAGGGETGVLLQG